MIREAIGAGISDIGENRVQDAVSKFAEIGGAVRWHLVGHLQTNKVRDAVRIFSLIHSVDSIRLAEAIDKEAGKAGKKQDALMQVNVSGEESKFGMRPEDANDFLKKVLLYPNIVIRGLMTIAPDDKNPESARPYFRALRELRDRIRASHGGLDNFTMLSMGMTGDFRVAVEEGATHVRVGRAIFGDRH